MSRLQWDIVRVSALAVLALAIGACTPQSAKDARGDLHLTAGAAAQASKDARLEAGMMGDVASDIMIDVGNIKEVEAWFDQGRPVSFD